MKAARTRHGKRLTRTLPWRMHHPVTTGLAHGSMARGYKTLSNPRPDTRGHQPPNRMGDPTAQP